MNNDNVRFACRRLDVYGFDVSQATAVELFAKDGSAVDIQFSRLVRRFVAFEIDPAYEPDLRRNLPGAAIKITDSYREQ